MDGEVEMLAHGLVSWKEVCDPQTLWQDLFLAEDLKHTMPHVPDLAGGAGVNVNDMTLSGRQTIELCDRTS